MDLINGRISVIMNGHFILNNAYCQLKSSLQVFSMVEQLVAVQPLGFEVHCRYKKTIIQSSINQKHESQSLKVKKKLASNQHVRSALYILFSLLLCLLKWYGFSLTIILYCSIIVMYFLYLRSPKHNFFFDFFPFYDTSLSLHQINLIQ